MERFARFIVTFRWTAICLLLAMSCAVSSPDAKASDHVPLEIIWQQVPSAPAVITEGPSVGEGYLQRTTDWLISHLPEFHHEIRVMPVPKVLDEMAKGQFICSNFLFESALRREYMLFSDPVMELHPIHLFIAPEKLPDLRFAMRDGAVDLGLLAGQDKLSIGISVGYRFDEGLVPGINDFLNAHMTQSAGTTEMVVRLFDVRRIDGFIAYEVNVNYYRETAQLDRDTVAVPIVGVPRRPLPVSCSGDKQHARKIIDAVNLLLSNPENRREIHAFYTRWSEPAH